MDTRVKPAHDGLEFDAAANSHGGRLSPACRAETLPLSSAACRRAAGREFGSRLPCRRPRNDRRALRQGHPIQRPWHSAGFLHALARFRLASRTTRREMAIAREYGATL